MDTTVSPLAPECFPELAPVAGVRFATGNTGLRYTGRDDLMVAELTDGTTAAGVYTKSKTCSAAIDWCRIALKSGKAKALIVNAGNANAFTGKLGVAAVEETVDGAAEAFGCKK
ncbi:MAG: bifunctional ornithine acetyltransferase/N-acetylglutamate synthase, partial [Cohaesibacter sp.]|nr:bifunctional ornithine acetyltransferase/N-acetylglutamate synthase [Cohaesibacter sp.]